MYRRKKEVHFLDIEEEQRVQMGTLVLLLNDAFLVCDDNFGVPNANQVAEYLLRRGVAVDAKKICNKK